MKLLEGELRKLFKNRFCLYCLGGLVLLNMFLLWVGARPAPYRPPASAYRQMTRDLAGLSAEEQLQQVSQQLRRAEALSRIDYIMKQQALGGTDSARLMEENEELFREYGAIYQAGSFLTYTPTLAQEYAFLQQIQLECEEAAGYDAFLDGIQERAALLSQVSVFSHGQDDYGQRNIRVTAKAYEDMRGRPIRYSPQKGLMTALGFVWTDITALFAMLALAAALVREERDNGMLALVRSTPGGRLRTAAAKLGALGVGMFFLLALLYGVNLLYCGAVYGLGDLSRSIQSVPALMRSTLKVNVAGYLGLFLLTKWAAFFLCGVWVLWVCLLAKRPLAGYVSALLLPGASWLIRAAVPAAGHWNVLKYANLVSLLQNNELLGGYRNLYWFGHPVQLPLVELITALALGALFLCLFCTSFVKAQLLPARQTGRVRLLRRKRVRGKSIFSQEGYKTFVLCGAAAVLAAFAAFQICQAAVSEAHIDPDEIYYASYMQRLAGPVTEEKLEQLRAESAKFSPLIRAQKKLELGVLSPQQYENIMAATYGLQQEYRTYQQVVARLHYIKAHPGAHLLYETGYLELFDHADTRDLPEALLTGLFLSLCCCGIFAAEHATDMQRVVRATPLGRKTVFKDKVRIGTGIAVWVTLFTIVPRLWLVGTSYGFSSPTAPLFSMTEYAGAPAWATVMGLMAASLLARLLAGWAMAMVVTALSQWLKNMLSAALAGSALLCIPPLLSLCGVEWAKWFSTYPLFHFGAMMTQPGTAAAAFLFALGWFVLGWLCRSSVREQWV